MIYASLKPIHQWRNRWTVPNYFALALMAGFLLLDLLIRFWSFWPVGTPILTMIAIAIAWILKETYWRFIDTSSAVSSVMSATGLGRSGRVRMLEPPHTQANYLLREMGFRIARKHRARLRLDRAARRLRVARPADPGGAVSRRGGSAPSRRAGGGERGARPRCRALAVLRRGEAHGDAVLRRRRCLICLLPDRPALAQQFPPRQAVPAIKSWCKSYGD